MSNTQLSQQEHENYVTIDEVTFEVRYRRGTVSHRLDRGRQRRLIEACHESGEDDVPGITHRFSQSTGTRINRTVVAAVLQKILPEGRRRASMPQPARAHWNFVMTGREEDQASSLMPQANDRQHADQNETYSDQEDMDFDEGGIGQSMNTTRAVRRAPDTQQAAPNAKDLNIPNVMKNLGNALAPGSGQTGRGQQGTSSNENVADLMSTLEKDLESRRGQTGHGQPGTSDNENVADLMRNLGIKLQDDREKQRTSSSTAAGKWKHRG